MAEEEENKKGQDEDVPEGKDAQKAGSKKKLILIAAIAAVALIGGGVAGFLMMGGDKQEPAASAEANEEADEDGAVKAETHTEGDTEAATTDDKNKEAKDPNQIGFGNTYDFKSFHLNLGNPIESHYIRLELSVEYSGGDEQKEEINRRLPQLRDAVVGVVTAKSREFLLSPDGKAQLRRELLIRINRYMSAPIENVFITDMLIE